MKPRAYMRGVSVITISDWPRPNPNPDGHKLAVYRDGVLIAGAPTLRNALDRMNNGEYDLQPQESDHG